MSEETIALDIPLLLPGVEDGDDECLPGLEQQLAGLKGITHAHVKQNDGPPQLCIHYDPNQVSLATVQRLAQETGNELAARYRHERIPFSGMLAADEAPGLARVAVEADGAAGRPLKAPGAHEPVIPKRAGWVVSVLGLESVGAVLTDAVVFRPDRFCQISGLQLGDTVSPAAVARAIDHREGLFKGAPSGAEKILFLNKADSPERLAAAREIVDAVGSPSNLSLVIGSARSDTAVTIPS